MKIYTYFLLLLLLFSNSLSLYAEQFDLSERPTEKEKLNTTRAIKYLQMASTEINDPAIKREIDKIVKYLSLKNLRGDRFSAYARKEVSAFTETLKSDFIYKNSDLKSRNKIILDSKINYEFEKQKYNKDNSNSNFNKIKENEKNRIQKESNAKFNQELLKQLNIQ